MIDVKRETLIPFGDVPNWCEQVLGKRISPATIFRWKQRGARGIKLETLLVGGARFTSVEAMQRFIEGATIAADEPHPNPVPLPANETVDEAYHRLESDGI